MLLSKSKEQYLDKKFYALGTVNFIKIINNGCYEALDEAMYRVLEIDDLMSAFKKSSSISRLNSRSGKGFVEVDNETMKLLNRAQQFSYMSSGAFDITIRPLVELWSIGKKNSYIPEDPIIEGVKKLVNYNDLVLDNRNCRAALRYPGQSVDLGGIAKGYAADEVKRILKEYSVENALINLGGNILAMGCRQDGKPWNIGVQNPMAPTGQHLGVLSLSDKTIVTSGSNERFFMKDNVRYHHIIDPRTGKPAQTSLLSVTAVCDCSMDADALTTALFILGMDRGMTLLKKLKADAIFITENMEIIVTDGLKTRLFTAV